MLPIILVLFVLVLLVSIASGYYVLKARTLGGSQDANPTARNQLKKAGLAIMAAPGALILAYTVLTTIASGQYFGYSMLIYALPFAVAFILTIWRPLLGASLSLGIALLLIVPAIGLIIFNYEMSAFLGIILLILGLVWLIGAWSVLSAMRKIPTVPSKIAGQ